MEIRKDIFGEEIKRDEAFEKSLAEMLETMPVANRPEYVLTEEDKKQPKSIKIRKSMSVADWDDCLK